MPMRVTPSLRAHAHQHMRARSLPSSHRFFADSCSGLLNCALSSVSRAGCCSRDVAGALALADSGDALTDTSLLRLQRAHTLMQVRARAL
jgi:hypothetical protein